MAVVDTAAAGLEAAGRGATIVQLRAPLLSIRQLESAAEALVSASPLPVLISSRADVALAAGAAGVNLPETDLPVAAARRLLGPERLVGRSVHSAAAAREAEQQGADYVIFGPVFESPTHAGRRGLGLDALAEVARAVAIPVLAIGGVDPERAADCRRAGAGGFAAISYFSR